MLLAGPRSYYSGGLASVQKPSNRGLSEEKLVYLPPKGFFNRSCRFFDLKKKLWGVPVEAKILSPRADAIKVVLHVSFYKFKFTMAARFELPNPPHTRPCRIERVHTPTAHLFRKCSNGAFCTSKQHISPRRNDRVHPQTRGGRLHRSGARPTARPQQQQQHQQPPHQQQTAAQQQHHKFARSEHHNLGRRGANSSR